MTATPSSKMCTLSSLTVMIVMLLRIRLNAIRSVIAILLRQLTSNPVKTLTWINVFDRVPKIA